MEGVVTDLRERTVGAVVAEDYLRAAVFSRRGIDFCCGGGKTVAEACRRAGAPVDEVVRELTAVHGRGAGKVWPEPTGWDLDFLTRYIVNVHHRYVRESLPVLIGFTEKVASRHGEAHTELMRIRDLFADLAGELSAHLEEEEREVFPRIRALEASEGERPGDADAALSDLVTAMEDDHARAGEILRTIRELTGGYRPPSGACPTWQATYAKLEEFEEDLHRHVHLENNVLFARLVEFRDAGSSGRS